MRNICPKCNGRGIIYTSSGRKFCDCGLDAFKARAQNSSFMLSEAAANGVEPEVYDMAERIAQRNGASESSLMSYREEWKAKREST